MIYYPAMKNFTVTYRGKDGKQEVTQIAAEDRHGVFDELAKRGILAIRVEEATGKQRRHHSNPIPAAKSQFILKGLVAVGLVIIAAVTIFFCLSNSTGDSDNLSARPTPKAISAISPVSPGQAPSQDENGAKEAKSARAIAAEFNEQAKEFVKKAVTNETQWIVPPLDPNDPDNALRTRVCQELGSLLSIEPGEPMPPFPYSFLLEDDMRKAQARGEDVGEIDNGNQHFLESLAKFKITAKETDDDHRLEHKEKLITAQGELLDAIDEGLSVNDTIRAAYEFRKRAYEMRTELCNLLHEIADEEGMDIETFKEQLVYANDKLKEEGIKAIPLEEILPDCEEDEVIGDGE